MFFLFFKDMVLDFIFFQQILEHQGFYVFGNLLSKPKKMHSITIVTQLALAILARHCFAVWIYEVEVLASKF